MVGDITGPKPHGIDNKASQARSGVAPVSGEVSGSARSTTNGGAAATDSVSLSDEAKSIRDLEAKAQASSSIDAAKVARLKAAIADGSYQINDVHVTEKLLALEAEFGDE